VARVPAARALYFTTASGNLTDDTTHRETWDWLRQLVGNADFLCVADCTLATPENLQYIQNQDGRFVTILPRTRREDTEFRQQLLTNLDAVKWEHPYDITNDKLEVIDRLRVSMIRGSGFGTQAKEALPGPPKAGLQIMLEFCCAACRKSAAGAL